MNRVEFYPLPPRRAKIRSTYLADAWSIRPGNKDNGPAINTLLQHIRTVGPSGKVKFEPGADYKIKTPVTDLFATMARAWVEFELNGARLVADGPLLTSGDMLSPGRNFHCLNGELSATSKRSAGALVKVVGDDPLFAINTMGIEFGNVAMTNGFDGVALVDGAGAKGVVGFTWDGGTNFSYCRGFAANGSVFNINTPSGEIIRIQNVMHTEPEGTIDANRPAATVHLTGCADFRMERVESAYARRGLLVDPPSGGRVATVFMGHCVWGQTTQEAVKFIPDAAADFHSISSVGGYCDIGGIYFGPASKAVTWSGMVFFGNSPNDSIALDGCSGLVFDAISFSGSNAKCFHAFNNAKNFRLNGTFSNEGGVNTAGVHIVAGCDKYQVNMVGGEYCTTPKTAPVDDATKVCQVF